MQNNKKMIWNIPNALTLLRLFLIPVYWLLMMIKNNETAALIVFLIASATDVLDGYIARKYHQVTDWGKLFDPLADKLMVLSVLFSLLLKGIIPPIILFIILIKEALMMLGAGIMLHNKVIVYSKPIGKIAQFVTIAGMVLAFFRNSFNQAIHIYVLWTAIGLTLIALFYYGIGCFKALQAKSTVSGDCSKKEKKYVKS